MDKLNETPKKLDRTSLRSRKHSREDFKNLERTPIVLVLDGVFGNYNQGALFRLADALMLEQIHFCGVELQTWHRRFLKSARGTHKWVPHTTGKHASGLIENYSSLGYQIVIVEQCEGSVSLLDAELKTPLCLVFGGELTGVSQELLSLSDLIVELPSLGMANSLNVAMSAGMVAMSAFKSYKKQRINDHP